MSAEEHLKEIMGRVGMAKYMIDSDCDAEDKLKIVYIDLSTIYTEAHRALEKVQDMRKRSPQYSAKDITY